MRTLMLSFAGLAALAWAQQPPSGQGSPPAPIIRENATVKLAEHVWAIPDFNVGLVPNVGIVVGSKATLVVDTGLGPRNGEAIVREMKKVSANEHSLGAAAFKRAKLLMTRMQQQDMTELGKQIQDAFAGRSAVTAELLNGVAYPTPDILFDRDYRLDLGGVHARLLWRGPAAMHTRGDTMIFVEEDRVLFTGDVVMSQRFLAAQNTSSITTWLSTLDELASLAPSTVVPSHGSIGDADCARPRVPSGRPDMGR
jgi:glyoxylase-like metal-dependent hydrolase (beta-lactamase superfamily II)